MQFLGVGAGWAQLASFLTRESTGTMAACARHRDGRVTCWTVLGAGVAPQVAHLPVITDAVSEKQNAGMRAAPIAC